MWMKSGDWNSVSQMWRLVLADFGRDARSSDSSFFFKKSKKLHTKVPGLSNSGRHNSAVIRDRRKFTSKWSLYGMSSFHFTVRINVKSFLWDVRSVQERYLLQFSAMSDVGYCVLKVYKNSSEDEIANVNVLRRHLTCRGQSPRILNWVPNFYYNYASMVIYAPNHLCTYAHHTELSEFVLPK